MGEIPPFAAISYPWRDLQLPEGANSGAFSVAGALHADPISISVLRTACIAARAYGCRYLWLDRLCILQNQKLDKNWQIQRMFEVYRRCEVCLVFPGGLVRLARLDDATSWIDRAWTLQEAIAPKQNNKTLKVVFELSHPSFYDFIQHRCKKERYSENFTRYICDTAKGSWSKDNIHGSFVEKVLEPDKSASSNLEDLCFHLWTMLNSVKFHAPELVHHPERFPVRIFRSAEAQMLQRALDFGGLWTWIAAFTRSSSRPIDMVFSIMQLFGVHLTVSSFSENDRIKATIALLQALMKRGSTATWLYIAPTMDPSKELSTLPEMPMTSESGRAYIQTNRGEMLAFEAFGGGGTNRWDSRGAPKGEMTDDGYFIFTARGAPMVDTEPASKDRIWAVIIGRFKNFNRNPSTWRIRASGPNDKPQGLYELTFMLIKEHADGYFHRIGMEHEIDERLTEGWVWTERCFRVGGPGVETRQRFGVSVTGPVFQPERGEEEDQDLINAT